MNLPFNFYGTREVTTADHLVQMLLINDIDTLFCVPGGAIEPLMNSISSCNRNNGNPLKLIVACHETGAAFMADGYFRETGKIAAVFSTTGPGATNLVTGVASASEEYIPMLVITAQTQRAKSGRRALQESSCTSIDTLSIFRPIAKYNSLVSHPAQVDIKLNDAISSALTVPYGPVHLTIPSDVLREVYQHKQPHKSRRPSSELICLDALDELSNLLASNRFAVLIGESVRDASEPVQQLIQATGAPFIASPMGKAWVDETHKQYHGVFGFAGHPQAKDLITTSDIDYILVIGSSLDELSTSSWCEALINSRMIHLDSNPEHFNRSGPAFMQIQGDIAASVKYLTEKLMQRGESNSPSLHPYPGAVSGLLIDHNLSAPECSSESVPLKPQRVMAELTRKLPTDTRIHIDAGNSWSWSTHYLFRPDIEGHYRIGMGFGSMAWSIGSAIGSCAANKSKTLCIVGDGSFKMSSHELEVAVKYSLPVVFIVMNDQAMGMVMHGQRLGQQESIGWQLGETNFAEIAKASGAHGVVVRTPQDLESIDFEDLFALSGPTILDIRIDREEVPPMGDRIAGLAKSSVTPGS